MRIKRPALGEGGGGHDLTSGKAGAAWIIPISFGISRGGGYEGERSEFECRLKKTKRL